MLTAVLQKKKSNVRNHKMVLEKRTGAYATLYLEP